MCCFSREVEEVSNTRIFARTTTGNRQFIVYSMSIRADEALAMILPIPVAEGTPEKGVRFVNLEAYPKLFVDLDRAWPPPAPLTRSAVAPDSAPAPSAPKLEVVEVGSYEASFVPTVADFPRLDERFRLPEGTWEKLGDYRKFGFAVFKLKDGLAPEHPMAFEFPRGDARRLFFPTVHVHDGKVHAEAEFDHVLYCQPMTEAELYGVMHWSESPLVAGSVVDLTKSAGVVVSDRHLYRRFIRGVQRNADVYV
jgi:hypothetical protein